MKTVIKLIRYEIGFIGFVLLFAVTLIMGMGMKRGFLPIPANVILLSTYLYFVFQVKRDREYVLQQISFLPNHPTIIKKLSFIFAMVYFLYIYLLQLLVAQEINLYAIGLAANFTCLAYFIIVLFMLKAKEAIIGAAFAGVILITGYKLLTPIVIGYAISTMFFSSGRGVIPQFEFAKRSASFDKAKDIVGDINSANYVKHYIHLTMRRNDGYNLDFKMFVSILLIGYAYTLNSIYQNQSFIALGYISFIIAFLFLLAFFFCILILKDLRLLMEFTGRILDVKAQLSKFVFRGYLGFMTLVFVSGILFIGTPSLDFIGLTIASSCLYLSSAVYLLTVSANRNYLISACGLAAVILMLLDPLPQLIMASAAFMIIKTNQFAKGKLKNACARGQRYCFFISE